MARARIELRGALSHARGGRTFKKGAPQIVTNAGEIAYYRSVGGFSVTMLEDDPPPRVKAPPPAATKSAGEKTTAKR